LLLAAAAAAAAEAEEICVLVSGTEKAKKEGSIERGAEISIGELERELLFGFS